MELPEDYQNHWFGNRLFELYHYGSLTKRFDKDRHYIRIYEYTTRKGKHLHTNTVNYNTRTSLYEVNTTRYGTYKNALCAMWKTDPPK